MRTPRRATSSAPPSSPPSRHWPRRRPVRMRRRPTLINEAQPIDWACRAAPAATTRCHPRPASTDPELAGGGWVHAQHLDHLPLARADRRRPDPVSFEVPVLQHAQRASTWQSCVAPFTKDGADREHRDAIHLPRPLVDTPTAPGLTTDPWPYTGSADTPDYDQSPARADASAPTPRRPTPTASCRTAYADESSTEQPMLVAPTIRRSGCRAPRATPTAAGSTAGRRRCNDGLTTLRDLRPGAGTSPPPRSAKNRNVDRRRSLGLLRAARPPSPATPRRPRAATGGASATQVPSAATTSVLRYAAPRSPSGATSANPAAGPGRTDALEQRWRSRVGRGQWFP